MESIINALLQLFVLSLVVERIVDVILKVIVPSQKIDASSYGRGGIVLSFILGLVICYAYKFDLIEIVTNGDANQYIGNVLTALVIAGGSTGIRAIIEMLRVLNKTSREEAQVRSLQARLQLSYLTDYKAIAHAQDAELPHLWKSPLSTTLTVISDRSVRAAQLHDAQGTYRRGCSEFVCAVLGLAYEQANDLMGDDPQEITDWSKVTPGAIVGWKKEGGSGHVSVYVKDGVSTYIDVREPAHSGNLNPKPRRLNGYGNNQRLYLSSRFGT